MVQDRDILVMEELVLDLLLQMNMLMDLLQYKEMMVVASSICYLLLQIIRD